MGLPIVGQKKVLALDLTLDLTDAAIRQVQRVLADEGKVGWGLRVQVQGGGCSGMQYALGFAENPVAGEKVLEFDGFRVFVDSVAAPHLHGTTIDYTSGLQGRGFEFKNPNAVKTCGCGSSFST